MLGKRFGQRMMLLVLIAVLLTAWSGFLAFLFPERAMADATSTVLEPYYSEDFNASDALPAGWGTQLGDYGSNSVTVATYGESGDKYLNMNHAGDAAGLQAWGEIPQIDEGKYVLTINVKVDTTAPQRKQLILGENLSNQAVKVDFHGNGFYAYDGGGTENFVKTVYADVERNKWYEVKIAFDMDEGKYDVSLIDPITELLLAEQDGLAFSTDSGISRVLFFQNKSLTGVESPFEIDNINIQQVISLEDRIEVSDFGSVVQKGKIAMFKHDVLDLRRLIHVDFFSNGLSQDVTDSVLYELDASDGSDDKANIVDGKLSLSSSATDNDIVSLLIEYEKDGETFHTSATIQVKPDVDMDAMQMNPPAGPILPHGSINLDLATSIFTANALRGYGEVTGFVQWQIAEGADIAELNGSMLTVNNNANLYDNIVLKASYTAHNTTGDVLLTNEFRVTVINIPDAYDGDIYHISSPFKPSSHDELLDLRIEKGSDLPSQIPLFKWQTLNLFADGPQKYWFQFKTLDTPKDLRVRGIYNNRLNDTELTDQVQWSLAGQQPGSLAEIVQNDDGKPVLKFTDQTVGSDQGKTVLQAVYGGHQASVEIVGLNVNQLKVEPGSIDLVDGEKLNLFDNVRVIAAGSWNGVTYEQDAKDFTNWTVSPSTVGRASITGEGEVQLSGQPGDTFEFTVTCDHNPSISATLQVHLVDRLNVEIDTSQAKNYNNQLIGFNDPRWSLNMTRYNDSQITSLVSPLKPKFLRFPGGSIGNYYNWKINDFIPQAMTDNLAKVYGNMLKDPASGSWKLSIDDFMSYCAEVGAEPVVQVNLLTDDTASIQAFVSYVENKGYSINYWEMGNELNLASQNLAFPSVYNYIQKSTELSNIIKSAYPSAHILAIGNREMSIQGKLPDELFMEDWGSALSQTDFYDYVVEHPYWYNIYDASQVSYKDEVKQTMLEPQRIIKQLAESYDTLYPGKKVALTEWGILYQNKRVTQNLMNAIYDADFVLNAVKYDNIGMLLRHALVGSSFELIGYTGKPEDMSHIPTTRASYLVFELLGDLFDKTDQWIEPNVPDNNYIAPEFLEDELVPELYTAVFRNSQTDQYYMAVINKSSVDKPLNIQFPNGNLELSGTQTMQYVTGDALIGDDGDNIYTLMRNNGGGINYKGSDYIAPIPTNGEQQVTIHEQSFASGEPIVVPRYSVAVVDLSVAPDTTAPQTPVGLTAEAGDGQVDLSWDANTEEDVAGYNLYQDGLQINTSVIQATYDTVSGLTNGSTYQYSVTAIDKAGNESSPSGSVSVTPSNGSSSSEGAGDESGGENS